MGGLKVVNATAQAFAEKSPVVVVSGAPGVKERRKNPLLHHKVNDFDTQQKIFEHITVESVVLEDPKTAVENIEKALSSARRYRRPVYIELPRDTILSPIPIDGDRDINFQTPSENFKTDTDTLQEALEEATSMINSSKQPVIVAGVEVQRFGLQDELLRLIDKTNIPVVSTVLSKSTISEDHPCFLGVYEGAMGFQSVREYVESSDCLILLGALMTDINFGISPTPIEQSKSMYVSSEKLSIKHHNFENIVLNDFLIYLIDSPLKKRTFENIGKLVDKSRNDPYSTYRHFMVKKNQKITVKRLFERLNFFITKNTIVIADVGDSLFGALDLTIHGHTEFLSPAYYLSMGFAIPAAIGAQLANPKLRPS